ncbi:MAG: DIP1984 family protein [Anaerolineae bacterium]|nr:DIP1984 family protein [Anaerolineae bacterium]
MKLAEALIQRADAQKRIEQLRQRLARSAKVQEEEQPPEDPQELLREVDTVIAELTRLIQQINRTNATTQFDDTRTVTDALAERDTIMLKRGMLTGLIIQTQPQQRYGRMEIKELPTVNIADIQKQVDGISRQYRELDTAIQRLNWTIDLIED